MLFNNGYPMNYQYMMPQMYLPQPQPSQQAQQQPQNGGSFYFVNSQKEAEEWVVGAGQTVFFFDRNTSVFYIKSVAQNGLSQPLEVYEYSQKSKNDEIEKHDDEIEFATKEELDQLKEQIDDLKKWRTLIDE